MISVCIATYNGEKYIRQQLDSIRSQLAADDEIIVSDDMSDDNTVGIIKSLNDARIKVFTHNKEHAKFSIDYVTRNFENALRHAKGDIIFLSDQDDMWFPSKVARMTDELLKGRDIIMSDCCTTDKDLNVVHVSYYNTERVFRPNIVYNVLKPAFLGSCMAFKRHVLDKALPFPKYGVGHDLWLGLVGLKCYEFSYINEPLMFYRRHESSVTDGGKQNKTSLLFKIKYRIYVLLSLVRLSTLKRNN